MVIKHTWTADDIPDLTGKIAVVTGANDGIGYESTRELARKGAHVVLTSRNPEKVAGAIQGIKDDIPPAKLSYIHLDLASLKSIRKFAEEFNSSYQSLDILINNAGIMLIPFGLTDDGFENTIGVNHLGHFALTGLLIDKITDTPGSRVVNVSSNAHYRGEMDFDNLLFKNRVGYAPMRAYSRSKLANLLFTYELQRRFQNHQTGAMALAAHPGISATGLADHLFFNKLTWLIQPAMRIMFQSSAMGALPSLRAADDPEGRGGQYYGPDGPDEKSGFPILVDSNPASKNLVDCEKLWDISQELTGVYYL